ncbi:Pycsar system effector family protein [Streptomyces collinus]|uniref:Pycsar system effector family protein n=1 Tax=Streptomyces collinus TaxID=42684 RepID=UPI003423EF26
MPRRPPRRPHHLPRRARARPGGLTAKGPPRGQAPTTPPTADQITPTTDKNLDAAVAAESGRTDGKASLLLAFNGATFAGLATLADHDLPVLTKAAGVLAITVLGVAAVLLLLVVRPRLGGTDRASFPYWARLDETGIRACITSDTRTARIRVLSGIAVGKFSKLRRAVDCTLAALVFLAVAALATLL